MDQSNTAGVSLAGGTGSAGAPGSAPAGRGYPYYLVAPDDTVGSIAMRAGLPVARLLALNSLPDQDFLYEGERLRLAASVPEPGSPDSPALAALAQQAVQENIEERQALALARTLDAAAEPVSAAQAQAEGPELVPGVAGAQSIDPVDYSVAADDSIAVVATETLGHYADWLGTSAAHLRAINHLRGRTPVVIGRRVKLDFASVTPAQFEQRRRDYHARLQAAYFAMHRIVGTSVYVARRGDSLWTITQHSLRVPVWLLQQYNPELNFGDLRPGTHVSLPRVEELSGL
jgi:membrane-bound lytic murein transglycosylase D